VAQVYRRAWEMGAKGITCYREGSREGILLTHRDAHQTRAPEIAPEVRIAPRPPVLAGVTFREETPVGTAFITINYRDQHPNEPFEVFLRLGKAGSDVEADAEALGRLISLTLRLPSPMPPLERLKEICAQLEMIGGARSIGFGPSRVRSMPDGIARTLGRYLEAADNGTAHAAFAASLPVALTKPQGMDSATQLLVGASASGHYCPRCRQAALIVSEGCLRCVECGFKEC